MGGACSLSQSSRRRLISDGHIPHHMTPYHRSLLFGCEECSQDSLKVAFRETDNRQSILLEVETLLNTCIEDAQSTNNIKGLFPCILPQTLKFVDMMPLVSQVLTCQLERESCYSTDDLATSPGLVNLFIQSERMKSFVDLAFLPFGGTINGTADDLLIQYREDVSVNDTQLELFRSIVIDIISDSSDSGEFISLSEASLLVNNIASLGIDIPSAYFLFFIILHIYTF